MLTLGLVLLLWVRLLVGIFLLVLNHLKILLNSAEIPLQPCLSTIVPWCFNQSDDIGAPLNLVSKDLGAIAVT